MGAAGVVGGDVAGAEFDGVVPIAGGVCEGSGVIESLDCVGDCGSAGPGGYDELISAEATDDVGLAEGGLEDRGDLLE